MKSLQGILSSSLILCLIAVLAWAAPPWIEEESASHMSEERNPEGCAGCHKVSGVPGTPLLKRSKGEICYECHGFFSRGKAKADVETVFTKFSKHPIQETTKYHFRGEDLPEKLPTAPRHVSCFDCHVSHVSTPKKPWQGARGFSRTRMRLNRASFEYELCYLCHSDSANRPSGAKNKRQEFDPFNDSYHPVELTGRNKFVPSLIRELNVNSMIACTDCHGNNDPIGAQGPHGSDYAPILKAEYRTYEGLESPKAYELCYMCHDRRSILGDEGFRKHSLHILTASTSCYTCHVSHGIERGKHLIRFSDYNDYVRDIEDISRLVGFSNTGSPIQYDSQSIRCYLRCHDIDHNINGVFRADGTELPEGW
ncbi:MAG: hypothetical protein HY805_02365 [Nitrospirae bacterium]|nr:hypothetical protein [Nitrospirota bacterium]